MSAVILVIHVLIAIAMVVVVLLQRSTGGALGGIGGGVSLGGPGGGYQPASIMTKITAVLAASFMTTSMVLAILASGTSAPRSVTDDLHQEPLDSLLPAPGDDPVSGPQVPIGE